ncbi:MAG: Asp-tRNA(Asn)/Glu-tRNA(Gln) amidotransferase subunit GatB [Holophagaceae bacterium]|nr:Asp-tRNA(Asn)/Glu-tRNA(Gln) amidotransferase subunit GatB [Holophagaceae bacterium]
MKPGFEVVIGLEIHVQLLTRSKMFCACRNEYGGAPNSHTCPVCLALPGALPVLNREAVRMAVALGLALDARIQPESVFYRKQYFYPDLPKGYQITQGPVAVVEEGRITIPGDPEVRGSAAPVGIRIERAHLEEDAGKSSHELSDKATYIDLNRAGVPLLEIVGGPDLRSANEAYDYLKALHRLVVFLGICDGNMEEGSFRCDANVSVRRAGDPAFGTRVEVKNLNSFRNVKLAIEHETSRHIDLIEKGEAFTQETRGWDADKGETKSQRSKEAAMDYRFFPEPDLPVLAITDEEIEAVRRTLPELPEARRDRLARDHGLTEYEAGMLLQSRAFADYFESVAREANGKQAANWMLGEVSRMLNDTGRNIGTLGLETAHLAELIRLVESGTINLNTAKEAVFPSVLRGEGSPSQIVDKQGLAQISDQSAIEALVQEVIRAHPGQLAQFKAGNEKLKGFFVGQVMKAGKGKVNPQLVNETLEAALGK